MDQRLKIQQIQPQAFKAMYSLEGYLQTTELDKMHKHLVKLRASQINGCAYCIDMHTKEAMNDGETIQRIVLLNAWKETGIYSDRERAVLAVTEEITQISMHGLSDQTYQKAVELFDENYVAQLIMAVITINAWNRIAISTHMQPGS